MSESSEDKPKIIVDEDWKSQVESEREKLRAQETKEEHGQSATTVGQPAAKTAGPQAKDNAAEDHAAEYNEEAFPLPPASFATLVSSLATQAIAALGQIPDPVERKPVVRLDIARHVIDTLDVIEQKTKGNLTADEAKMLSNLLHELRMVFVHVQRNPPPVDTPK
jgi:hypothetical protein